MLITLKSLHNKLTRCKLLKVSVTRKIINNLENKYAKKKKNNVQTIYSSMKKKMPHIVNPVDYFLKTPTEKKISNTKRRFLIF